MTHWSRSMNAPTRRAIPPTAPRAPIRAAGMAREWLYQDAEVYGVIRDRHQQSGWTPQALTTAICRRLGVIPPALDDHGNLRWKNSRVVRLDSPPPTALQSLTP